MAATPAQIHANRLNTARSTGPKPVKGKEAARYIAWDAEEGKELDEILGNKPEQGSRSRVDILTKGIASNHWVGLDPTDFAELSDEERTHWAVAEVGKIIDEATRNLATTRANLDTSSADRSRAEAAERTMFKTLGELRLLHAETSVQDSTPTPAPSVMKLNLTETLVLSEVPSELASFCTEPRSWPRPGSRVRDIPVFVDPNSSFASFAVGHQARQDASCSCCLSSGPSRSGTSPSGIRTTARAG